MTEPPIVFLYLVDVLPRFSFAAWFAGILLAVLSLFCLAGFVSPVAPVQEQKKSLRLFLYSSVAAVSLILFSLLTPSRGVLSTMLGL